MYFNKKNSFPHGIMFHHFHDNKKYLKEQGSISKDQFIRIIKFIGRKNILDASDFLERTEKKTIKKNSVVLTFDDCRKSQYDIILDVLDDFKIQSFFFIYSSLLEGKPDMLEIYRHFRSYYYKSINDFYSEFFKNAQLSPDSLKFKYQKEINLMKRNYKFYSTNDVIFRVARDKYLKNYKYHQIMNYMIKKKKLDTKKIFKTLVMNKKDILHIKNKGHIIGLHSHSHPTDITKKKYIDQYKEYKQNIEIFGKKLKIKKNSISSMSHPCGKFNDDTFKVLDKLNIKIGFTADMIKRLKKKNSNFLIPREDHSNIIKNL
jgi:peptidoglycan/xylan/chitin deacetylase (PgdA/CDA1 family)